MAYGMEQPDPALSILGPRLKLSTLGCSSTHNNKLQILQRTIGLHTSQGRSWPGQQRLIATEEVCRVEYARL